MTIDALTRGIEQSGPLAGALRRSATDAEEEGALELLLQSVHTWAGRSLDALEIDRRGELGAEVYRSAGRLGLFGLTVPQPHGGAGLSLTATSRVIEELATFDRSAATAIGLHCGLGLRGLVEFGAPGLQRAHLPELASGQAIAAFAATEPDAGSHIAGVRTVAQWDGGTTLTLSGSKCYVTNGGVASVYTVLARTPELGGARRGYSLLLVKRGLPGLSVGVEERKLGLRGTSTTTLSFDDVRLDTSCVIGPPGQGLRLMGQVLSWGRLLMASGCVGSARTALERAARYVALRRQFGRPLAEFGLVREKVAAMRASLYEAESVVRLTTLLHDLLQLDVSWPSAVAKVIASERAWEIADSALQLHGGAGYLEDTGVALILRDCRITRIFEGANDVLRYQSALELVTAREDEGSRAELAPAVHPELAPLAEQFDRARRRLSRVAMELRQRFGVRLAEHQLLLGRVSDAANALFGMLAVLLRASGELQGPDGSTGSESPVDLATYLVARLSRTADAGLDSALRVEEEALVTRLGRSVVAGF